MGGRFSNQQHTLTTNFTPGRDRAYEDTLTAGVSPLVLDVKSDLGKNENAHNGYFICDGDGDILWEYSDDGTNYGDQKTAKDGDSIDLNGMDINKIRLTHSGTDSAYRIMVL